MGERDDFNDVGPARNGACSSQYVARRLEMPKPVCCQNDLASGANSAGYVTRMTFSSPVSWAAAVASGLSASGTGDTLPSQVTV